MTRILRTLLLCGICSWVPLVFSSCRAGDGLQVGSETHFLSLCQSDDSCGEGLVCVCGACTMQCSAASDCVDAAAKASCEKRTNRPFLQACAESEVQATCEGVCDQDSDCAELDGSFECDRGLCRKQETACAGAEYGSDEFILLGDRFLAESGQVTLELEELLRDRGALSADEKLRDHSSGVVSPFGGDQDLFSQYELARAEGPARVAVFNAGGPDALLACDVAASELCPNLQNAKEGTENLLATMVEDGVEHVILFFYPRPDDASLADKFNLLESELIDVCSESPVACHFLSLAPFFEQERDALLTGMGLFPTDDGALVAAGALFSVMREECFVH